MWNSPFLLAAVEVSAESLLMRLRSLVARG